MLVSIEMQNGTEDLLYYEKIFRELVQAAFQDVFTG